MKIVILTYQYDNKLICSQYQVAP